MLARTQKLVYVFLLKRIQGILLQRETLFLGSSRVFLIRLLCANRPHLAGARECSRLPRRIMKKRGDPLASPGGGEEEEEAGLPLPSLVMQLE